MHEGGHSDNGGVLPGGVVYLVPPKRKEGSKERDALRFASTVYPSDNKLSLLREQREEYPHRHSQEVEVLALANSLLCEPVSKALRSFLWAGVKPTGEGHSARDGRTAPGCSVSMLTVPVRATWQKPPALQTEGHGALGVVGVRHSMQAGAWQAKDKANCARPSAIPGALHA